MEDRINLEPQASVSLCSFSCSAFSAYFSSSLGMQSLIRAFSNSNHLRIYLVSQAYNSDRYPSSSGSRNSAVHLYFEIKILIFNFHLIIRRTTRAASFSIVAAIVAQSLDYPSFELICKTGFKSGYSSLFRAAARSQISISPNCPYSL